MAIITNRRRRLPGWTVTQSAVFTVQANTPISECIKLMRDRNLGSILVLDYLGLLVGIFTERDLVKWIDQIVDSSNWSKPISIFMSKPVFTLPLEKLDQAADIMIQKGIRHIPIVHNYQEDSGNVVGIISMRDLIKEIVLEKQKNSKENKEYRVGLLIKQISIRNLVEIICARKGTAEPEALPTTDLKSLLSKLQALDYLFVDLDDFERKEWTVLLKILNEMQDPPDVFLFYSPEKQPQQILDLLKKLSLSKQFSAYMKPLSIFNIIHRMRAS